MRKTNIFLMRALFYWMFQIAAVKSWTLSFSFPNVSLIKVDTHEELIRCIQNVVGVFSWYDLNRGATENVSLCFVVTVRKKRNEW